MISFVRKDWGEIMEDRQASEIRARKDLLFLETIHFPSVHHRAKLSHGREGRDYTHLKRCTFSFALQLELITELLGTPTLEDMRFACEGARSHMLRRAPKPPSLTALYTLSSQATHEAVHLLCQMLVFDPVSFLLPSLPEI